MIATPDYLADGTLNLAQTRRHSATHFFCFDVLRPADEKFLAWRAVYASDQTEQDSVLAVVIPSTHRTTVLCASDTELRQFDRMPFLIPFPSNVPSCGYPEAHQVFTSREHWRYLSLPAYGS